MNSKVLEALKIVERDCEDLEQVPYVEFALIEKSLKALEIIKKKNVNIKLLKASSDVEQYNNELIRVLGRWFAEREFLTIEEFSLLKEVLKC